VLGIDILSPTSSASSTTTTGSSHRDKKNNDDENEKTKKLVAVRIEKLPPGSVSFEVV
jgi:hypothetical protein